MFRCLVLRVCKVRSSLPFCNGGQSHGCRRVLSASAVGSGSTDIDQAQLQVAQSPERRKGVKYEGLEGGSRMRISFPGLISQSLGETRGACGAVRRWLSTTSNSSSEEEKGQKNTTKEAVGGSGTDGDTNQERKINVEGEEPVEGGDVEPPPEDDGGVIDEEPVAKTEDEVNGIADDVAQLAKEVSRLETELGDAKAKTAFLAGEIEVVRHIAARDTENGKKFAVQKFAKSLLDVADNLDRAISAVPEEEANVQGTAMLLEGVMMTQEALQKVFKAHGINRYGVPGDVFDPNLHDALYTYEDKEAQEGTIGQVLKPGYKLQGRILRAAQVGTVKMKKE